MEQATNQLQKLKPAANQSSANSILYVNSLLTISCVLSCIVFLLVSNVSLNRRLNSLEHNLDAIVDELKALKVERFVYHKKGFGEQRSLKRRERGLRNESLTVLQWLSHRVWVLERETTVNLSSRLQGLTRRVRVLETNRTESTDSFNELSGRVAVTLESRVLTNLFKNLLEVNTPQGFQPGPPGPAGRDGRDGRPGLPGLSGRDGREGREGRLGPRGLPGPKGDVGNRGPQGEKGGTGQTLSGVNYNRWGRTNCSGDASVVYTGLMASGFYNDHGGGSNFLCLTDNPKYDKRLGGGRQRTANIYTAEYESSLPGVPSSNIHGYEVPCAVCYVRSRGSQMMIPATNKCPAGWTREYHGYLMSSHYTRKHSTEFVCIDADPEVAPGHKRGGDGALLYVVAGQCGALPCKPFINNYELTCVVCTK